jgi:hypothetical protein
MTADPIVEEVRRIKEEHAAQYGYDVRKMAEALRRQQSESGRKIVSFVRPPTATRTE